ncbi:hypothetical protein PGB90_006081 [Kerria lacca]
MSNKSPAGCVEGVHFLAQFISGLLAGKRVYGRTCGTHLECMSCTNFLNRNF